MSKKVIWILVAIALVLALVGTGVLFLLPKDEQPPKPSSTDTTQQPEQRRYTIIDSETVGAWARDRAGDSKIGPEKSYDEFIGTYWNPQAPGNYQGEPGIIYLLDGYYDLTDVTAYFANREYFFKLYVSSDCQNFTEVFEVNADNMAQVYNSDYCCSITGLDAKNVAYLKLVFTGSNSADNNAYISLRHVKYGGTWVKEGPDRIPIEKQDEEKKKTIIADYMIVGSWVRDREGDSSIGPKMTYDGNDYTLWNPQANGKYQGNPGIVYMLDGYYDLNSLRIITDKREYYMQVHTSSDGMEYELLADITPANYQEYYDGFTCSLENLSCKDVGYIRLIFTGSNSVDNNTYLSLAEVEPAGTRLDKPAPTEIPDTEPKVGNTIIAAHRVSGSWIRDREDLESLAPAKSYDENAYSYWNPQANGGYAGKPGIVYMLDGYYDVEDIQLIFGNREYFFEVYTSSDGYDYDLLANVASHNMSGYYEDLTVNLTNLKAKNVGYVKLVFTGSNSRDNNTYVSLMEVVVRGTKLDKEGPTSIPDTDEKVPATKIADHMVVGSWVRDREDTDSLAPDRAYDENLYSGWNPQANSGYMGKPGIIYRLKSYYSISGIQLNFDKREYFFELYTSADGLNFQLAAAVTRENMASYYKGYVCTFSKLNVQKAGYIKLVFTGSNSSDNNTYVSLMEVLITGTRQGGTPGRIPQQPQEDQAKPTLIAEHLVIGSWIRDREDTPSLAPDKSYDENLYTGWNPQANSGYAGNPGIVYMLSGYYDVTDITLTFDKREYFFEVYTSADGTGYDLAGKITAENMADYYDGYVCSLNDLDIRGAGYVKLVFTGSNSADNNTYISLMEVEITGKNTGTGAPSQIPQEETPSQPESNIVAHKVTGQWLRDREGDSSIGPQNSYDGNLYSGWNPQADSGYAGDPSIVYMLSGYYDVTGITLTFDKREYFTEVYTSSDGLTYTLAATVTVENYGDYYEELVCSLTDLNVENVGYVKLLFTGSNSGDNNTYVSLMEVAVEGTRRGQEAPEEIPDIPNEEPEVTEPTEPEATDPTEPEENGVTIVANQVVGSWANDRVGTSIGPERTYDGNLTTNWNPAVTGFNTEAAIVYALDRAYDLNSIRITFGSRHHYITVSVSTDGTEFTELGTVNSGNAAEYYTDLVCELSQLTANNVQYIKVTFIGTQNGTTWINMMEIQAFGTEAVQGPEEPTEPEVTEPEITEPEVTEPEVTEPEVTEPEITEPEVTEPTEPETTEPEVTEPVEIAVTIVGNQVIGSWANDRVGTSIGPERTYDGSLTTNWNPAVTGFTTEAAIVYTLDQDYDLTEVILTFGTRMHYIAVSVSADNEAYTEVARITSANAADYYDGLVCSIGGITAANTRYIKITFIGTENGTTWINMMEITGKGIPAIPTETPDTPDTPETPEDSRPVVEAVITVYEVIGTWVRDREGDSKIGPQQTFDADVTTIWNPQATNYRSGEGIIYTLDKAYDLEKIALTFGTRQYYFTLHVSSDGESYTQVAEVNSGNAASYYTELVCTVEALNQENIRYIKILFTGSANSTTYISLADVEITGRERIVE